MFFFAPAKLETPRAILLQRMTPLPAIPTFSMEGLAVAGRKALDDIDTEFARVGGIARDPRAERRAAKRRTLRLGREGAAAEQVGRLPELREDIVLIATGKWHGFDMLAALIELAGEGVTCRELYVSTLGFNRMQADTLAEMLDDGRIERCTFMVSNMFTQKNPDEYDYLAAMLHERGQTIGDTRNHTKLMLLELSDGRHIVTHGSLNLRRCNCFEQMAITQDPELFAFFAEFISDALAGAVQS